VNKQPINTGGSAFPVQDCAAWQVHGMTLRDYFAAQALAELCGAFGRVSPWRGETQEQADARWCYARADAMLAERNKQ